ncbi:MAG TPA: hypothetical protein VLG91_03450 [Streptomyces sp.]|nr:hypothetical protein [Streptomyces sp.]
MGWKSWSEDSAQTVEEITQTVNQMHDDEAAGHPVPDAREEKNK